ncbi:MAG: hypothetical protein H0T62_03990 [Parachlamydiaceae bacterium]|nr:hypothetical protein [Parachlamydiaceae bacterium]
MTKFLILSILCLLTLTFLLGHEGHKGIEKGEALEESAFPTQGEQLTIKQYGGRPQSWPQWIGSFHFIFLHFPLALIPLTTVSELLFAWCRLPIFDYSSRFMLISAAILAVPTALLGLTYSYTTTYSGLLANFVWAHMWAGIATAILAIIVVFLRELYGTTKLYYACLVLLLLILNLTGFLGGGMTFGPYHMHPPL